MDINLDKVGPCGTCCSECIASKDDPAIIKMLIDKGIPEEVLPCKGCRAIKGHCPSPSLKGKECGIYTCAEEKGYEFCFECKKSPCDRLLPSQNTGSYVYHNIKCFNLLYIQNHGLDKFIENSSEIVPKYLQSELRVVGESPKKI